MKNEELLARARELKLEAGRERRCMGIDSERRAAALDEQAAKYLAQVTQNKGSEQNRAVAM